MNLRYLLATAELFLAATYGAQANDRQFLPGSSGGTIAGAHVYQAMYSQ